MKQAQQGDVLITAIDKLPKGLKLLQRQSRGYVLVEGEVTGHAHCIRDDIMCYRAEDGTIYLKADKPFTLFHEEHKAITWVPGIYRVGRVREMDHIAKFVRKVED